jgi:hypothetical protein
MRGIEFLIAQSRFDHTIQAGEHKMRKDTLSYGALALAIGIASVAGQAQMNAGPYVRTKFAAPKPCVSTSLAGLKLAGLRTKSVTETPEGSFTPPGAPAEAKLPAFCRVEAVVTAGSDSVINFEVMKRLTIA